MMATTRALPLFITSAAGAEIIGFEEPMACQRQRARLEADHLFPLPMPTSRRPMRWKADEVQAWVARNGNPMPPGVDPTVLACAVASGKVQLLAMAGRA